MNKEDEIREDIKNKIEKIHSFKKQIDTICKSSNRILSAKHYNIEELKILKTTLNDFIKLLF